MMLDIYSEEKGKNSEEINQAESLGKDGNSDSHCNII